MLTSLLVLGLCLALLYLCLQTQRPKNFPPGPAAVPIFGNILNINLMNPLVDLDRLAKRYGNVYSLFIGPKLVVVLSGLKVMKQALVIKGAEFAGRPQDLFINDVTQRRGIILEDFGPKWREQRRFALMTLRNFGLGKQSMEERILAEIKRIIEPLEQSVGKTINPQVLFHNAASNVIFQVLCSKRYDYDDAVIKLIVLCFRQNAKLANGVWAMLYDSIPMIRHLPLPFMQAFKNIQTLTNLFEVLVAEHMETRVPGKPRDFLDCYLDKLDERGNDDSTFSVERLSMYLLDLHFAGTDTTSNTLLTGFLYLMTHPHVQERCQQEIDEALKGKDEASFEDRHKMPYIQAVIHEIQRIANTVPLGVYHSTTKDTELMGYSIPKGAVIMTRLDSVLEEEGQWKSPHGFHPENFLTDQGEFEKPDAFMPFSAGPRVCLGEGLARMELFLIIVTLLRRFKFVWPEDAGEPDYDPVFGIILTPKPYSMGIQLRASQ